MNVAEIMQRRRQQWRELEELCEKLATTRFRRVPAHEIARFAALYRAACADLALADAYLLPPATVQYLHRLIGRAHNQLYRSRYFDVQSWARVLFVETPQKIFHDGCVQLAFLLFWGVFLLSACFAYAESWWPQYAEQVLTRDGLEQLESSFSEPIVSSQGTRTRTADEDVFMASFYIRHNTNIGLKCFAGGLLVIPGICITTFNAAFLGAAFGYMARPDVAAGANFFHFVTAHGPFELTAIVMSAAAGLRLGWSWIRTGGWSRGASLTRAAREAMPLMGAAMILFVMAAFLEGFVSPSVLPYPVKAGAAIVSSTMLMFYFLVLGYPRSAARATG